MIIIINDNKMIVTMMRTSKEITHSENMWWVRQLI